MIYACKYRTDSKDLEIRFCALNVMLALRTARYSACWTNFELGWPQTLVETEFSIFDDRANFTHLFSLKCFLRAHDPTHYVEGSNHLRRKATLISSSVPTNLKQNYTSPIEKFSGTPILPRQEGGGARWDFRMSTPVMGKPHEPRDRQM